VFDAEYAGQYPEEVGANEIVGEAEEGETVGSMLIEGNAVGTIAELPE
jgi:hypothetical protein